MTDSKKINKENEENMVRKSIERAIQDAIPATLIAFSYHVDFEGKKIRLRAHFEGVPTADDIEDMEVTETELATDFLDRYSTALTIEVVPPGGQPNLLPGVAYRRGTGPLPRHWRGR